MVVWGEKIVEWVGWNGKDGKGWERVVENERKRWVNSKRRDNKTLYTTNKLKYIFKK